MINNYTAPQPTIAQFLEVSSATAAGNQNLLVAGTNYQIQHAVLGGAESTAYAGSETTVALAGITPTAALDATYTKLFGVNVLAKAAEIPGAAGLHFSPSVLESDDELVLYSNAGNTVPAALAGAGLNAAFSGRSVRIGDFLRLYAGSIGSGTATARKVIGLIGAPVAASVSSVSQAAGPVTNATTSLTKIQGTLAASISGDFVDLTHRPMYNGRLGDRITLVVTTAGGAGVAKFSVGSVSGLYNATNVACTAAAGGGLNLAKSFGGATVKLTASTVSVGDSIVFDLRGAYTRLSTNSVAGTYAGTVNTTYLIRVTKGGAIGTAEALVYDTAGLVTPFTATLTSAPITLGTQGLAVTLQDPTLLPQGGYALGDIYAFTATAATVSTSTFIGVKLDGPAYDLSSGSYSVNTDVVLAANVLVRADGEITATDAADATENFVTGAQAGDGVIVRAGLQVRVPGLSSAAPFGEVVSAKLYAQARGLITRLQGETYFPVSSVADILATFGEIHPDNPIAWALNQGVGAAGKTCYGLRVNAETSAAYAEALVKTLVTDNFYVLSTTTDASAVLSAVKHHLTETARPTAMQWRTAFLPVTTPTSYPVRGVASAAAATVTTVAGDNLRLRDVAATFSTLNLRRGDEIRINFGVDAWGAPSYQTFLVDYVVSDTELRLQTGPVAAIPVAVKYEIHKPGTPENVVPYMQQLAQAASSRRIQLVWVDAPRQADLTINGGLQTVAAVAAEVAGLRAGNAPHQGLTKFAVSSVSAAPSMYALYTKAQLDAIASAGVFIIGQDQLGGTVYIRHQLTTDTNNGPLYYESSCTSNLDSIDYAVKGVINKYIGRWNATRQTVQLVKQDIATILQTATQSQFGAQLGPQIAGFDDTEGGAGKVLVFINPLQKDRIVVKFNVQIPLPLNGVDVYTFAITLDTSGSVVESTITAA